MLALPTAFVTHLVSDTQATKRVNEADERVKEIERSLSCAVSKTAFLEDVEARSLHLTEELNKVRAALQLALGEHQKASELNQYLQQTLTTLNYPIAWLVDGLDYLLGTGIDRLDYSSNG
jgi:hypothetical protein